MQTSPRIDSQHVGREVEVLIGEGRFRQILRCLNEDLHGELKAVIDNLLSPLVERGSNKAVAALSRVRNALEASFLARICESPDTRNFVASQLADINGRMSELASQPYTIENADEFWRLDGKFHTEIGIGAGAEKTAQIVAIVQESIESIGKARECGAMRATVTEHGEVIELLQRSETPSHVDVCEVVGTHAASGLDRWRLHSMKPIEVLRASHASASLPKIVLEQLKTHYGAADREFELAVLDVALQKKFGGQCVAWLDAHDDQGVLERRVLALGESLVSAQESIINELGGAGTATFRGNSLHIAYQ